ncbi:GntR family transcriptional regulator [Saxibacter everestensis]|uniref:GntR family transcriptional regulator n=1 Tax=Saxibacter everestensis TaxID=2909229 RepID=A0ABY8QVL6_9MICO|nr:GntR family transcriptional regulator [Brevibacteriaceae bacterium ZFBP1038]
MPIPTERNVHGRVLLRDLAYDALCEAITTGTLAPGEALNDQDLAAWLGFSRTPVREALGRLEANGLVLTKPGRSTIVAPIDPQAINEAMSVAAALHELAMRTAVDRFAEADIARMVEANQKFAAAISAQDAVAALDADDEFHAVAIEVCHNELLSSHLDQVMPTLRRAENQRFGSILGQESIDQHRRIVTHVRQGEAELAARAVRDNWQTLAMEQTSTE